MEIAGHRNNRKQIRQPVSVPFIWEEKPEAPKKDWKPSSCVKSSVPGAGPPLKLVASIPFKWEEKPGKPLPCFTQPPPPPPQLQIRLPPKELLALPSTRDQNLVSQHQCPLSPDSDTESTTSSGSYTTTGRRSSSLVGPSFLHRLFPLLSPHQHPDFRDKLGCSETETISSSWDAPVMAAEIVGSRSFVCESNCSAVAARRPRTRPTLGELLMMSRRRSFQTGALQLPTHNSRHSLSISMDFTKTTIGCWIFGANKRIERGLPRKWKRPTTMGLKLK